MLFTFTWTVRVKSINCTDFSKKKKLFMWTVRQWSMSPLFSGSPPWEVAKCCFYKTCSTTAKLVGPTSINHFFFLNQMVICGSPAAILPNGLRRDIQIYSRRFMFFCSYTWSPSMVAANGEISRDSFYYDGIICQNASNGRNFFFPFFWFLSHA